MVVSDTILATNTETYHPLSSKWCLWAHLPHDTDWSLSSYKNIHTLTNVESTIAVTESMPENLVKNCMLFVMREGIKPTWEDPSNREGGCFSYKVTNKYVYNVWKELTYVLVGNSISEDKKFVANVNGITISPKKNFCIVKIWMSNCDNQDPSIITRDIHNLNPSGSIFKKHVPEY